MIAIRLERGTQSPRAVGRRARVAGGILLVSGLGLVVGAGSGVVWALRHPEPKGQLVAALAIAVSLFMGLGRIVFGTAMLMRRGWARKAALPGLVLSTLTLVPMLIAGPSAVGVQLLLVASVTALPLTLVATDLRRSRALAAPH
ncbi:MAG: hypothetical protein SGJ13_01505 [Actinomycetota bacterium]|nr:hypothetical protein [Actinomycetota bacterium]